MKYLVVLLLLSACSTQPRRATNLPCNLASDCSSGLCHHGVCASAQPRDNGGGCADHGDCKSFLCINGVCLAGNRQDQEACLNHQECISGHCIAGKCLGGSLLDAAVDGPPPRCGDNKIDGKEECDGKNFGGKTCTGLGFTGGNLACKTCKRDTSGCYKIHDPKGLAIAVGSGDQMSPAVTFGGNNFLVVWVDHLASNQDIRGTRVSKKGAVLNTPAIPISINASNQTEPAVAAAGASNYLVVWSDNRSGGKDIYGARISATGSVMDNAGFLINSAKKDQKQPAATFHNSTYLVAWSDDRNESPGDIYGARVNTGGTVLDTLGITISSAKAGQQRPSLVWGQVDYMVVWDDTRDGQMNIYGAQVNPLGSVQDPTGKSICTAPKDQQAPAVAYDGSDYLVVWTDQRGATQDIYGTRIDGSSKVLDASGIAISKAANSQLYPAVAAGKTGFLVVWEDHRKSGDPNIYGARVNRAGEVLDPGGMPISTATGQQSSPDIAFDGDTFLVVWGEKLAGGNHNIRGTRVSP